MKTPRIHIDTSAIGGCFDAEFEQWSNALFEDFRQRRYVPVVSDVTAAEIEPAPAFVRAQHEAIVALGAEVLQTDREALDLVSRYTTRSVLGPKFFNDMLHIALATIAEVDVLVSWNFRHIVRFDKIRMFNAVNIEQGYKPLTIYSPREVMTYGSED